MTQSSENETVWLTTDAFNKLTAELEELKGPKRQEVIDRIAAARDEGDLKENGGYHAAREEQGKVEGKIAHLEDMLRRAEVGEAPADSDTVAPGMVVSYRFDGDDEVEKFLLGSREIDPEDLDVYSPQSPLGTAVTDAKVGDTVEYEAPNGKMIKVTITDAHPYAG